jgi:very-short-patch-repair endonuclease
MRWRFIVAGLPRPTVQIVVGDPGRRWHKIDLGWEDLLLGVEFDGLEAHMTRQQLADDRDRHNWLTERQWMLLHFTGVDVYRRHEAMVETVRRQMRRRRVIMAR